MNRSRRLANELLRLVADYSDSDWRSAMQLLDRAHFSARTLRVSRPTITHERVVQRSPSSATITRRNVSSLSRQDLEQLRDTLGLKENRKESTSRLARRIRIHMRQSSLPSVGPKKDGVLKKQRNDLKSWTQLIMRDND